MEIRILHLYYDIMSLYGEYANVEVLKKCLSAQNITVSVDRLTLGDTPIFSDYGFIYIGSGTEKAELTVLGDVMKYREEIKAALDGSTVILATGNSFELFGKNITDAAGNRFPALAFFDYETVITDKKRTVCDQVCTSEISDKPFVGFINKASSITGIASPLFSVKYGSGNSDGDKNEGISAGNFYGTHLTGPCLMKNPHFADHIASLLCKKAGVEYRPVYREYEEKAYQVTLEALEERFGGKK